MNARALFAVLATSTVLVSGCASGESAGPAGAAPSVNSSNGPKGMSGMDMSESSADDGPSETASMVCTEDEIRVAVQKNLGLKREPTPAHIWSKADRLYSCTYRVPGGTLLVTVQDAVDDTVGRRYYDKLRSSLPGAETIRGMENFGFPAFQTRSGNVVFIKDGKTLQVDPTALRRDALPAGFSRQDVAYGVASAVIACWTE